MIFIIILLLVLLISLFYFNRRFSLRYRVTLAIFGDDRERNQKHCYDFPSENNGWEKYGKEPVFRYGTNHVFDPFVYMEDNKFVMCVSDYDPGTILLTQSRDGINWDDPQTILEGVSGTWEEIVNRGTIVKKDGLYYMWYTGQKVDYMEGRWKIITNSAIGFATSKDGIHYDRVQRTPVLYATEKYEGTSLMNPCVIWNNQKQIFQMWYSGGEAYEPDVICYAESKDGITWIKHSNPVLAKFSEHEWEKAKVGGCNVVLQDDGTYSMYYIGYQNLDVARICMATSSDGIHWIRPKNNLVLGPTRNSWDADATYKPSFIHTNDAEYLWYNGRRDIDELIGLAKR